MCERAAAVAASSSTLPLLLQRLPPLWSALSGLAQVTGGFTAGALPISVSMAHMTPASLYMCLGVCSFFIPSWLSCAGPGKMIQVEPLELPSVKGLSMTDKLATDNMKMKA